MKWLLALLLLFPTVSLATTLTFTLPTTGQDRWVEWDPELAESVLHVTCDGSGIISDSLFVRLYGQPVTGGGFRLVGSHVASGRKGQTDSLTVPWPGNFYLTVSNGFGESCASNTVTVMPTDLTGVEEAENDPVVACLLFDVRGRYVRKVDPKRWRDRTWTDLPLATGIYWLRATTKAGVRQTRRVVVLR